MKNWIGVDISKAHFDAAFCKVGGKYEVVRYDQTEEGFAAFRERIAEGTQVAVELTGGYSARLLDWLHKHQVAVHGAQARAVHAFKQMQGKRSKTDKVDAIAIAQYAASQEPPVWIPTPDYLQQIQQLNSLISLLKRTQTSYKNQIHALSLLPVVDSLALSTLQSMLETAQTQTELLEKQVAQLLKTHAAQETELLLSIPGIGPRTTAMLILLSGGFKNFKTGRELAAYLGLTPTTFTSGSSVWRKSRISKEGNKSIRALLYMCTLSAMRYNQLCKDLYERLLQKGKHKDAALMAVAHKLVRIAFAVVQKNTPFDPNFLAKT